MLVKMQKGWKLIQSFLSRSFQKLQWLFSSWVYELIRIELIILMLIVMQLFLVRVISYSLNFKCWDFTAVVLLLFKCHTQRMEKISCVSRRKILCWIFWKKKLKKKVLEPHQDQRIHGVAISRKIWSRKISCTYGESFNYLNRKSSKSWSKKILILL